MRGKDVKNLFFMKEKRGKVIFISSILSIILILISIPFIFASFGLTDHTVYNSETNTCTGSNLGMNVEVSPCKVQDIDGKNIVQNVDFQWAGANTQDISWVFVYEGQLEDGKIEVETNQSYQTTIYTEQWVSNYLINNIASYENITGQSDVCELGTSTNSQKFKVTYQLANSSSSKIICFTNVNTINATAFEISGYEMLPEEITKYQMVWNDVSSNIQFMGSDLLGNGFSYYKVQDITFQANQKIKTKWTFTPKNKAKVGKWHIFGHDSVLTIQQAISQNKYLYLDPWWNSTWYLKRELSNLSGYNTIINITYDSDMQADFDDIRFLNNDTELNFELIDKVDSTWATYKITIDGANTIEMYYGNSQASSASQTIAKYLTTLASEYLYDETSGTTVIDEQISVNATNYNSVGIDKDGRFDRAFEYTNVNDKRTQLNTENYMRCTSGSCVVSVWFKDDGDPNGGGLVTKSNHYQDGNANGWHLMTYNPTNGSVYVGVCTSNACDTTFSVGINISDGEWHNVIAQFGSSGQYIYVDGTLNVGDASKTKVSGFSSTGAKSVVTGVQYRYTHSSYWSPIDGFIDEVYLRTGTINSTEAKIIGNITFYPSYILGEEVHYDLIPPETTILIATPFSPVTSDNLDCNATLTDNKATTLTANWTWYKNGVLNLSGTKTGILNNTNTLITNLLSGNITKGENWTCGVIPYDDHNWGNESNVTVTVDNIAPEVPIQLLPVNGSNYAMESTIIFVWNNSDDIDFDSPTVTYDLYIYNESDMTTEHLIYTNTSITEGVDNTSISVKLSDFWAVNDDYYWYVRAYDQENYSSWSDIGTFQYANWTVTFNLTDSETGEPIDTTSPQDNFDISCDNGFNVIDANNPYTATDFGIGIVECTFYDVKSANDINYFDQTENITVNSDSTIEISVSKENYLTAEEHTWLEAIYNCINGGNCALYNILVDINNTVNNIWNITAPTDESVVLSEIITNKVVNSTNNLTIDYSIFIPIKAGYSLGDYLPVRIGYWFLDSTNTSCYNQGERPEGVSDPYCQPLIVETIGPMGGIVNFTVELQPALVQDDNYTIKRTIDIDPLGVWYNYGSEIIGKFSVLEGLSIYGASVDNRIDDMPNTNQESTISLSSSSGGSSDSSESIKKEITNIYNTYNVIEEDQEISLEELSEDEITQLDNKPGITGGVIGSRFLSGWGFVFILGIFLGLLIMLVISKVKLNFQKQ
jgi:hypothetical protein